MVSVRRFSSNKTRPVIECTIFYPSANAEANKHSLFSQHVEWLQAFIQKREKHKKGL